MTESTVHRVLVVGGGITGGVLSLALAQKGVEVVLVDLRPELSGVGHGITLQGNALKAFKAVGIVRIGVAGFEADDVIGTLAEQHDGPVDVVTGDRDLIFDAIANLVDNAIKHGRPGGRVVVTTENSKGRPVISIADDGPGIPPNEYEHVFKRFYRLEHSRYTPGNGLGLSLVGAVARLHGARIEMLDNSPGLNFRLWFSAPSS